MFLTFSQTLGTAGLDRVADGFDVMKIRNNGFMMLLEEFMLSPGDPHLQDMFEHYLRANSDTMNKQLSKLQGQKWYKRLKRTTVNRPPSKYEDDTFASTVPWLEILKLREAQVLSECPVTKRLVDLDQHGDL